VSRSFVSTAPTLHRRKPASPAAAPTPRTAPRQAARKQPGHAEGAFSRVILAFGAIRELRDPDASDDDDE
jgi:hypothetical protein